MESIAWALMEVVVIDGDAKLKENGTRAGSTLTSGKALKNLIAFTGRPAEEAYSASHRKSGKASGHGWPEGIYPPGTFRRLCGVG